MIKLEAAAAARKRSLFAICCMVDLRAGTGGVVLGVIVDPPRVSFYVAALRTVVEWRGKILEFCSSEAAECGQVLL